MQRYAATDEAPIDQAFWVHSISAPQSGHGAERIRVFSIESSKAIILPGGGSARR